MGYLRFRRSFRLTNFLKLNVGKKSASMSIGKRGYGGTIGTSSGSVHIGIPGTGLSYIWTLYRHKPKVHIFLGLVFIIVIAWSVIHIL